MNNNLESDSSFKSSRRIAFLACVTTAFLLCSIFGVIWLFQTKQEPKDVAKELTAELALETARTPPRLVGATPDALETEGDDLLFKNNDPASAVPVFATFVREYPSDSRGYHGLAIALRETGRRVEAITNHDRAIEVTPDRADYYYARGTTHLRLRNYDLAISDFEAGLKHKQPSFLAVGLLQTGLAVSHRAKGDLEKALAYNEEAVALNPNNSWNQEELALTRTAIQARDHAKRPR